MRYFYLHLYPARNYGTMINTWCEACGFVLSFNMAEHSGKTEQGVETMVIT
jgi:hypothetical protein